MKQASKSVYIKWCSTSWSLVYYSINFVHYKGTEVDPDNTEPTDEGDTQMKYSSH